MFKDLMIITTKGYYRNNLLRIFKKYLKISFVPICFQHLPLTNLAFLPCLYYKIFM
jgi:hypothetical protein